MAEYTIDKIEYGDNVYNLSPNVVYATCSTAAATAAKVATITSGTLNSLNAGDQVIVKFTYANGKASPTLKVGSTDAKSIMRYGTTAPSTSAATSWNAGSCVWFVYDGTYWQMAGWINSTYTVTDKKLETAEVTSGTTYYPILSTGATTAATRHQDSTGFSYAPVTGTASAVGGSKLTLGNATASGTAGNKQGVLNIYGSTAYSHTIQGAPTAARTLTLPDKSGTIALTDDIPTIPTDFVTSITTTAGAHTAITNATGAVSFKVPTTAAHVGAAASDHTHGNITNGGDITATAPTIASGDQIIINDHSASKITNGPTFDGSTTTTALTPKGTWESFAKSDTNTTYELSGALSSHKFTSTLTAGGSGSGTTSSDFTLAAGTGITITDDTSNRKMTIACSVTNTDTKLQVAEVTSGTTYYPLVGTGTTAATRQYDTTGCSYTGTNGTANNYSNGKAILALGNNVPFTSNNWKRGVLRLYGNKEYYTDLISGASYNNREVLIPNKSGTIALLDDLPPIQYIIIYEDTDSPGTYNADLSALDLAQIGNLIYVNLNLLNANDEYDSYILTDYYMEYATEDNEIYYPVLWFTNEFRRVGDFIKRITCGIYLDETETTHAYGEVTVNVREIGERYTVNGGDEGYTTNISTTADQFKQLAVLNLPAGKWIITARARFTPTSSSNHYSAINIGTATAGSGSTTTGNSIRDRRYGEGTYFNQHALTRILHLTTDTPVYLNGGGSNVSGTWNRTNEVFQFDAIRIS